MPPPDSASPCPIPTGAGSLATPAGQIIISRHGRPALDRNAKPRLTWREYQDWWARYECGSLADGQTPPQSLIDAVADAATVLTSERPRAIETANLAAPHLTAMRDALFNEAPLPPPCLPNVRFLPKTWNVLARGVWMHGHSLGGETHIEARDRAKQAARALHAASTKGKVYLAAHGWFNRMIRPELKALGWHCAKDGGDAYWSFRTYEWRA